jgi:hypothetical protein
MLVISVGIGFLLLFGVLISDGISGSSARTSLPPTDTPSRTRKSDGGAAPLSQATPAPRRPHSIGTRPGVDDVGRAA